MAQVPIQTGLFTEHGDARGPALLAARCPSCAQLHFPATAHCPYCSAAECSVEAIGARGTLHLATVVNAAPPGYRGEVPYGFGVVELPEGLRVVTRLAEARIEELAPGRAMRLEIAPLFVNEAGDEVLSFAYAPAEGSAARSTAGARHDGGRRA